MHYFLLGFFQLIYKGDSPLIHFMPLSKDLHGKHGSTIHSPKGETQVEEVNLENQIIFKEWKTIKDHLIHNANGDILR